MNAVPQILALLLHAAGFPDPLAAELQLQYALAAAAVAVQ
jgi:hypothetical protein